MNNKEAERQVRAALSTVRGVSMQETQFLSTTLQQPLRHRAVEYQVGIAMLKGQKLVREALDYVEKVLDLASAEAARGHEEEEEGGGGKRRRVLTE